MGVNLQIPMDGLSQKPFTDDGQILTYLAFQFLLTLVTRTGGKAGGFWTDSLSTDLTAAGTTQADALALPSSWNEITTTPAGSGAVLTQVNPGQEQRVMNQGANALLVYPPSVPASPIHIDALADNAGYSLAVGKMQIFQTTSTNQIRSMQLG